jgi:hypothetical protein
MISGRYVAPSFFQNITPLVNAYLGKQMQEKGDTQQMQLAEAVRNRNATEAQDIIQTLQGTPNYKPAVMPPLLRDDQGSLMPPVEQQVGQAPNRQLALMKALKSTSPMGQMVANTLITKSLEDPKEFNLNEGDKRFRQNPDGTTTLIAEGRGKATVVGNSIIVDGKEVYKGEEKPVQIDTGTAIQFRNPKTGQILWSTPKSQMITPRAPQVIDTANGPMLVNTYTGQASPIMMNGQPIPAKLNTEQTKDIVGINQQRSTIDGAIKDVEKNKSAFSFGRGLAQDVRYGESIAGRFEKPEDTQARAYVFNNVSAVIKERAGTAQSAQELSRINSFLPATTDNADQIISKLKGFRQYLDDVEKGTRVNPNIQANTPQPKSPVTIKSDAEYDALPSGTEFIDPKGVRRRKP